MEKREQEILKTLDEKYGEKIYNVEICSERYAIIKLKRSIHAILNLKTFEYESYYYKIVKCSKEIYLADMLEGGKILLHIYKESLLKSKRFKKIIKIFEKNVIIETYSNTRMIVDISHWTYLIQTDSLNENDIKESASTKYAIWNLPNGKKAFIFKEGLISPNIEFEDICDYAGKRVNDIFKVVRISGEDSFRVFRIKDLKLSKKFKAIRHIGPIHGDSSDGYVEVKLPNGKKAIMRIEDFEISFEYEEMHCLSYKFVSINNGENVMRLSDFSLAQWEKK